MPLYQCDIHLLQQFSITQSFFCTVCGTSRSTASMMEFDFFFSALFAVVIKYFIAPRIWKSILLRFIDREAYFWPVMTAGKVIHYSSRLMRNPFFSTFKNGQLFCFPSVGDKQSSTSAGRRAVCWPSMSKHAIFFPISSFPSSCASYPLATYFGVIALFLPFILNRCLPCLSWVFFRSFRVPPFSCSDVSNPDCPWQGLCLCLCATIVNPGSF